MLNRLEIEHWNQFNKIELQFDEDITILTGANGAGKSTLFRMLANDMGWSYLEISNPIKKGSKDKSPSIFYAGISEETIKKQLKNKTIDLSSEIKDKLVEAGFLRNEYEDIHDPYHYIDEDYLQVGSMSTDKGTYTYYVPEIVNDSSYYFRTKYESWDFITAKENPENHQDFIPAFISYLSEPYQPIEGLSIPSHRHPYNYEKIDSIPVHPPDTSQLLKDYFESVRNRTLNHPNDDSPILTMKKSIVSLAIFGEDNTYVEGNSEFKKMIDKFNEILKNILPEHLKFNSISIVSGEVVMVTQIGDFLIDAASGGIGALIDIAWQVFMVDYENSDYVVVIDELENHLHPSMQREILPKLLKSFPNAQFIVSTHSPFIINSINRGKVYALKYNENGKVDSHQLDFSNNATDAFDILKEVLGVSVTMPIWLEEEIRDTISKVEDSDSDTLTTDEYKKMKMILNEKGLSNYLPELLKILAEKAHD
ncbi:AAA family ATPase [Exiguobacterium sp. s152]|uniref:AAA family ATPase n=1 Tax=Exiguobacterium sp. s152 TaxID=2751226 RepID=UPI001BE62279|nr:AAA family ATPase [Exiguobacterium sp. s152]